MKKSLIAQWIAKCNREVCIKCNDNCQNCRYDKICNDLDKKFMDFYKGGYYEK